MPPNLVWEDKSRSIIKKIDLLLKSQEISPTHALRYQLESTMFYNVICAPREAQA